MSVQNRRVFATGTTRSSGSSPVRTSVGRVMRAQSGAKSSCRASRTRSAISDGIIGALAVRSPWRTKNPRRDDQVGNVARTSGQTRIGAVATNAGADSHGRAIQRACCGFGFHPGAGADTSTSDVTAPAVRPHSAARRSRRTRRRTA